MNFTSPLFLLTFLPLFLAVYLLVKPAYRAGLLLIASTIFLALVQWIALPWLGGLGLVAFVFGQQIANRVERKENPALWLWLGIGTNLILLIVFKILTTYLNPASNLAGYSFTAIIMPLGLSYFTFQIIGYLIDIAQANIPAESNFLKFLGYIYFFPKVAAGPMIPYQELAPQLDELKPQQNDVLKGLGRILTGIVKSVVIARPLGLFVAPIFNQPQADIEPGLAWVVLTASFLQIYFDFSGYTDIAIGLGQAIGIRLPENFNYPFISDSISDFWRRWHMTLIAWFREYVFYPLERRRLPVIGQQINLLIVFTLTGLWHGPTLNYLLWGVLQGIAIIFENTPPGRRWLRTAWRPLRHVYTLALVLLPWVFFRSGSLTFALEFLSRLAGSRAGLSQFAPSWGLLDAKLVFIIGMALIFSLPAARWLQTWLLQKNYFQNISHQMQKNSLLSLIWAEKFWWLASLIFVLAAFGIMFTLFETTTTTDFIYVGF